MKCVYILTLLLIGNSHITITSTQTTPCTPLTKTNRQESCTFCTIVARKSPAKIIHETDEILVFESLSSTPESPHWLIIPKKHITDITSLTDADTELAGKLFLTARDLAKKHNIKNYQLHINNGAEAAQTQFHLHVHFTPFDKK